MKKVVRIKLQNNQAIGESLNVDLNDRIEFTERTVPHLKPLRCYFFINDTFTTQYYRDCLENDKIIVKDGLEMFHIRPEIQENKTKAEILTTIEEIGKIDFTEYSGLMIIISSHGQANNIIWAYDDNYKLYDDMINVICKIPSLKDKMKIFIVQACKGVDQALRVDNSNEDPEMFVISEDDYQKVLKRVLKIPTTEETEEFEDSPCLQPDNGERNLLVAFPTFEGYVSYRLILNEISKTKKNKFYSIFIKAFMDTLKELGKDYDVGTILNRTRDVVRECMQKESPTLDQVSSTITHGTRPTKFKFQDYIANDDAGITYIFS